MEHMLMMMPSCIVVHQGDLTLQALLCEQAQLLLDMMDSTDYNAAQGRQLI